MKGELFARVLCYRGSFTKDPEQTTLEVMEKSQLLGVQLAEVKAKTRSEKAGTAGGRGGRNVAIGR